MASIHCYLLHSNDKIRNERYNRNKNNNNKQLNKFNINFINFISQWRWKPQQSQRYDTNKSNDINQTIWMTNTPITPHNKIPWWKNGGKFLDINLGIDFNEWDIDIEDIQYKTMTNEVTNKFNIHKYESISNECYNKIKNECKNIYKLQYNNNNTNEFIYTINELISLKIYTDLTDYQYAFRRVFWSSNDINTLNKRQYFYNLAKQFIISF